MRVSITAAAITAIVPLTSAHGTLKSISANGVSASLIGPDWVYSPSVKDASWRTGNQDLGYVASSATYINSQAINCHHRNSTNGGGAQQTTAGAYPALGSPLTVAAGSTINITWRTWAQHPGPTIDYLARCPGACNALADASQLQWFKIRQSGYLGSSVPGGWESSAMKDTEPVQKVVIPANLQAGEYVLRHEIIAVHPANQVGATQMYPMCSNIKVTGGGSLLPAGTLGINLYKERDPGIYFNPYAANLNYQMPGPEFPTSITNQPGFTAS